MEEEEAQGEEAERTGLLKVSPNTMSDNIDDNPGDARIFYILVVIAESLGLLCLVLVFLWTVKYFDGFAFDSSAKTFNYHPVFMVLGLVFLYGNSAIAYRVLRNQNKFLVKIIHACLHFGALLFALVGLIAVFKFHNDRKIPNMYSLHSWVGIATFTLFGCQFLFGFWAFLFPKFGDGYRRQYLKIHTFFGASILALVIVACISGLTEKMLFNHRDDYKNFIGVGNVANLLGLCLILFWLTVSFIIFNSSYKRVEKYELVE